MTWTLLIASLVGIAVLGSTVAYVEDHWKAYRYTGRHRGVYKPPALGPRVRLWDKDMVYLGDVPVPLKFFGVVSDLDPETATATLTLEPPPDLASIPLPDLPFEWEPHYTTGPGQASITVVPKVEDELPFGWAPRYPGDWDGYYGSMDDVAVAQQRFLKENRGPGNPSD